MRIRIFIRRFASVFGKPEKVYVHQTSVDLDSSYPQVRERYSNSVATYRSTGFPTGRDACFTQDHPRGGSQDDPRATSQDDPRGDSQDDPQGKSQDMAQDDARLLPQDQAQDMAQDRARFAAQDRCQKTHVLTHRPRHMNRHVAGT